MKPAALLLALTSCGLITTHHPPRPRYPPELIDTGAGQICVDPGPYWSQDNKPIVFEFGWGSCDADRTRCDWIPGEHDSCYTIRPEDRGRSIMAVVDASNEYGTYRARSSPFLILEAP